MRCLNIGKVKHISIDKKNMISVLLEATKNYAQRETADIEGVSRQSVQGIVCLIKQSISATTSSGRSSCGRRMKTSVR